MKTSCLWGLLLACSLGPPGRAQTPLTPGGRSVGSLTAASQRLANGWPYDPYVLDVPVSAAAIDVRLFAASEIFGRARLVVISPSGDRFESDFLRGREWQAGVRIRPSAASAGPWTVWVTQAPNGTPVPGPYVLEYDVLAPGEADRLDRAERALPRADSLLGVSYALEMAGRYDESDAPAREALRLKEAALGQQHIDLAECMAALGRVLVVAGGTPTLSRTSNGRSPSATPSTEHSTRREAFPCTPRSRET